MVDWRVGISWIVVGVDLEVERQTLDALLGAEVGRQALHGDVHLQIKISRPLENLKAKSDVSKAREGDTYRERKIGCSASQKLYF